MSVVSTADCSIGGGGGSAGGVNDDDEILMHAGRQRLQIFNRLKTRPKEKKKKKKPFAGTYIYKIGSALTFRHRSCMQRRSDIKHGACKT